MAIMNFGGVDENVVTREEFPLEKAREILKDETIAVIGYGVQGPGQSMNLRDNGFNVIVGQRKGSKTWDKAVADGWVPGETLFEIEEACQRGTIIEYLLSDAAQIEVWPKVFSWIRHHLQRAHGYRSSCRCRCSTGCAQRFGNQFTAHVLARSGAQFELCYFPRCDRARQRESYSSRYRSRFGIPF